MSTPTPPTDHDNYEALAVAWAVNALDPADQAIFEAHRAECERCMQAAFEALDIAAELAHGVPDVTPPTRLRERVLAGALPHSSNGQSAAHFGRSEVLPAPQSASDGEVDQPERRPTRFDDRRTSRHASGDEADPLTQRPTGGEAGRRPKGAGPGRMARAMRGPRRLVYALAAAVLVAGSAVTTWEINRPAPTTDRIAALNTGSGTVATVVARQDGADVVTDMLPPNTDRGTAYYIWGVPAGGDRTPQVVGTFEVTTTGLHSYPLRLIRSLDGYPLLAVSEEKAGSTPSAPSRVLGKGLLGR